MSRKKIFMLAIAACLLVLSIAGTSLAYFTDTDAKTNVFTSGDVEIQLNYEEAQTELRLYPGQTYVNDGASIENIGDEKAYVGAIIDITLPDDFDSDNRLSAADIAVIFTNLNAIDKTVTYGTIPGNTNGCRIYCVVKDELNTTDQKTAKIFDSIHIPELWGHAEVSNIGSIKITGYAVQTVGFTNAATALKTAFPDVWTD